MGNDVNVGNIIVGFGGVFVIGLIGIAVHLYLGRREQNQRQDRPNTPPAARADRPAP